eukprot:SAG11_NODE_626_length_8100_cov_5.500875_1_plen_523_part_10
MARNGRASGTTTSVSELGRASPLSSALVRCNVAAALTARHVGTGLLAPLRLKPGETSGSEDRCHRHVPADLPVRGKSPKLRPVLPSFQTVRPFQTALSSQVTLQQAHVGYEIRMPSDKLKKFLEAAGPVLGLTLSVLKMASTVARPAAMVGGINLGAVGEALDYMDIAALAIIGESETGQDAEAQDLFEGLDNMIMDAQSLGDKFKAENGYDPLATKEVGANHAESMTKSIDEIRNLISQADGGPKGLQDQQTICGLQKYVNPGPEPSGPLKHGDRMGDVRWVSTPGRRKWEKILQQRRGLKRNLSRPGLTERPLPFGWVEENDQQSDAPIWRFKPNNARTDKDPRTCPFFPLTWIDRDVHMTYAHAHRMKTQISYLHQYDAQQQQSQAVIDGKHVKLKLCKKNKGVCCSSCPDKAIEKTIQELNSAIEQEMARMKHTAASREQVLRDYQNDKRHHDHYYTQAHMAQTAKLQLEKNRRIKLGLGPKATEEVRAEQSAAAVAAARSLGPFACAMTTRKQSALR